MRNGFFKVLTKTKFGIEIFAQYAACVNIICEGDNVLCKLCENVIGNVVDDNEYGIFVKLLNFRLVEYQPLHVDNENTSRHTITSRISEVPNHLKRKAFEYWNEFCPKYFRPNDDEPICLMRVFVPPNDTIEPVSLPEFDINDTFSDISDFENDLDIDLDFKFIMGDHDKLEYNSRCTITGIH